jgi:hypothetical protein
LLEGCNFSQDNGTASSEFLFRLSTVIAQLCLSIQCQFRSGLAKTHQYTVAAVGLKSSKILHKNSIPTSKNSFKICVYLMFNRIPGTNGLTCAEVP